MSYVFVSPGKYILGKGLLGDIAEYTGPLGDRPFVLLSKGGMQRFGDMVRKSFEDHGINPVMQTFGGECTKKEIDRQAEIAESEGCDYAVGIGGGKVTDTAKFVAWKRNLPTVVCPTIAATDAPTPGRAVLYSEEGVSLKTYQLPRNPELVLVDAEVIAKAPVRLLVSGMGDALATRFETGACLKSSSKNPAGGYTTVAGASLAEACYNTLIKYGAQARQDAMNKECTLAVERIVEVNTLLSGLGFESGGLATAHAINKGLTHIKECDAYYHGEKVAFGTLCQLILEDQDPELINEVFSFCKSVGLPTTLEEIGLTEKDVDKMKKAAAVAADPEAHSKNEPFKVTPDMVYQAMLKVNQIGHAM